MITKSAVVAALDREVKKLVVRHNQKAALAARTRKNYEKRSGLKAAIPSSSTPDHWAVHPQFNPYYVRPRIGSIGHAISGKVQNGKYEPNPTLVVRVPKPSGGTRRISMFSIPDAAVSYWLGNRLIQRNSYRFSSYTYAYRADRNAHHAIEHLMGGIRGERRLFVLEYDFSKYFDTIRHDYLWSVIDDHFQVSPRERELLEKFLQNPRAEGLADYVAGKFEVPEVGIPQGNNISLFLANVACFELDREIERVGVVFARYADDTLVLADSYAKADKCAKLLMSHGDRSGTQINLRKSPGISLLTKDPKPEIRGVESVDFLSHRLSSESIAISDRALARMKARIAKISYNNLLLQPKRGAVNSDRVGAGFHDWDLVTCVNEIRRYIYGRISEQMMGDVLDGNSRVNRTLCALSFYPTVDEAGAQVLKGLDGWLVDTLTRTYAKRVELLNKMGIPAKKLSPEALVSGSWYSFPKVTNETSLPSFYRAWLYVRKAALLYGLDSFPSPNYDYI